MKTQSLAPPATLPSIEQDPSGKVVRIDGEDVYCIENYDRMRPFFMSIVSNADHWMFISSTGALTAGRRDADHALFPYYTDDKIHDSAAITGSKTMVALERHGKAVLWRPFSVGCDSPWRVRRNLYKSFQANKILFEEINDDLALTFRYAWCNSEQFGFIRRAWLLNHARTACRVRLVDGIQNLLPSGTTSQFQLEKSTLLDAYKRNERVPGTRLALFTLSSIPVDRPEPAEALRATTAWSVGLTRPRIWLRTRDAFADDSTAGPPQEVRGERGAYLLESEHHLTSGKSLEWIIGTDVDQDHSDVVRMLGRLRSPKRLKADILKDIERGTADLRRLAAAADGLQTTRQVLSDARHYSNVLFNIMRGGIFDDGYRIDAEDLRLFVRNANRQVAQRHASWLAQLRSGVTYDHLVHLASRKGDAQLERICREYLPLTFSRRHGDPSRPWNRFSIAGREENGRRKLYYEGNWRDIFQNWEALAVSYPGFIAGMICRFVNASTADGYNPYRITRDGLDWEVLDPHDPWSFIGYWGDHQVIYLLRLLEILQAREPQTLREMLSRNIFSFADVPYRIKDYASLLANPRDTVLFDSDADARAAVRVKEVGSDGKLLWDASDEVRLVNLTEKLLISILAKLSNFIPEAGIWLNTQRPEWNDANNALVGNGASMVTLCYLRRCFDFLTELFGALSSNAAFSISIEVRELLQRTHEILERNASGFGIRAERDGGKRGGENKDTARKRVLDELGKAGADYRSAMYKSGFSGKTQTASARELADFFTLARAWMDQSIQANKQPNGLYEAYNLARFERDRVTIRRLYPMLEGQVAVLSSGLLSPEEALDVLEKLRASSLYRADQHSYLLYPDRDLPRFLEKNQIFEGDINRSSLLKRLLREGNRDLVLRDEQGIAHFHGSLRNAADVRRRLERLRDKYPRLVEKECEIVVNLFDSLFDHESFTGRSGTFFAYEGLGSIYWHMVSKLLLAAQENYFRAVAAGAPPALIQGLAKAYYDIREGIGDRKTPVNYGAFPMDPYSHTPRHKGASQPGLTGQVKEDILCRWGELGVFVMDGRIRFMPSLLRREEFLENPGRYEYVDLQGQSCSLRLPANSLAFTYCQTPVIYRLGKREGLEVLFSDGSTRTHETLRLDAGTSHEILQRTGKVRCVTLTCRSDQVPIESEHRRR